MKKILVGVIFLVAGIGIVSFSPDIASASENENEGAKYATGLCNVNGTWQARCYMPDPQGPCTRITECGGN